MSRIAAILPAAGMGTRMGAETPKQFLELDGTPIVILSLRRIAACPQVTDIIVATRADEVARLKERIAREKFKQPVRVVKGGDSRQESVAAALREVANDTEIVLVHDAVRPFVTPEQIARERVVLAQTPQAFSTKLLKEAFARAEADGVNASDEAGLVERMGHDVHVVLGSERNMKITKPADMELARFYLERERKKA